MALPAVLTEKRDELLRIASAHRARNVRVFGSVARGNANPDSDINLLVTLASGATLLDVVAIKQDLEDLLGCEVDVVTERALSPYFRDQLLNEAIEL